MMETMNKDNALRKVLIRKTGDLPFGFEKRVMDKIMLEAEKKSRRNYYLSLGLVSAVSLAMIVGTFYLLNRYFSFNILELLSGVRLHSEASPLFTFCFYIAFLILVLLGLDYKFRELMKRFGKWYLLLMVFFEITAIWIIQVTSWNNILISLRWL